MIHVFLAVVLVPLVFLLQPTQPLHRFHRPALFLAIPLPNFMMILMEARPELLQLWLVLHRHSFLYLHPLVFPPLLKPLPFILLISLVEDLSNEPLMLSIINLH
mgnify:CR=1 FL=1